MDRRIVLALVAALALAGAGCKRREVRELPVDVVLEFLATMRQVHGDPKMGERAVGLLDQTARENLIERARRASALSGRQVSTGEILVPSSFSPHLVPASQSERILGETADVTVVGRDGRRAVVRLVLEEGHWRIQLELPALAPIRQRERLEEE